MIIIYQSGNQMKKTKKGETKLYFRKKVINCYNNNDWLVWTREQNKTKKNFSNSNDI